MKRICFLLGGFQSNGGIGRSTSILANHLCNENDLEIHTISYCETSKERLYEIDSRVREHLLFDEETSMTKALLLKNATRRVKRILKENKIGILISCGTINYPLGILAVMGTSVKCICVEHTSPEVQSDHKFQALCRKIAVKKTDMMVTITDSARDYYIKELGIHADRVCRIYNPVPEQYYQSNCYQVSSRKIISVGRLSYPKNFSCLIDIAKVVLERHPDWCWDIFGEGEEQQQLQQKINDLGISDRIQLRGQVPDLLQRYGEYSFIVMTSRYEGFPMSLLEAAANRLPMVSFDIKTGPNEIIQDGVNGYLLDKNDISEMIERICNLVENKHVRLSMSKNAYEMIARFDIARITDQWRSLFDNVMSPQ